MDISKKYFTKIKPRHVTEGINVKTHTMESNGLSQTISDYVQKYGLDPIVIATHNIYRHEKDDVRLHGVKGSV
jgi:hypothetical protein